MKEGDADPALYDFRPYRDLSRISLPGGKSVAVWVSPNLEFYEIDPPINPHRKAWPRPHPDVVGYGHRDYANRVGHWRMAEVMGPGSISYSIATVAPSSLTRRDARTRLLRTLAYGAQHIGARCIPWCYPADLLSSSSIRSRITTFCTLPVIVIGISVTKRI